MNFKRKSALLSLVFGALMLYSFTIMPTSNNNCTISITASSSNTSPIDVTTYSKWAYIPKGRSHTWTNCLCETEGTYIPYVETHNPGSITFTVYNPDSGQTTSPATLSGLNSVTYQAP